jgi:A/G-specific adenine glycosylase
MELAQNKIRLFQEFIWNFYHTNGRIFAWRNIRDPYKIVVSEIMLQQTQTYRVEQKYEQFITELTTFDNLASASLRMVFSLWQGLGYNRRALYLQKIAQKVTEEFGGQLPDSPAILETFPGIGKATAASICAFAFNSPTIFIETNIRAVFIHSFFPQQTSVTDKNIMPLIEQTLDGSNPREWYYALMDYGVTIKKRYPQLAKKSAHYNKQSKFEGSDRQIRGMIIKILTEQKELTQNVLIDLIKVRQERVPKILGQLVEEGLIKTDDKKFYIK